MGGFLLKQRLRQRQRLRVGRSQFIIRLSSFLGVVVNLALRQDQQDFIQACLVSGRYTPVVIHQWMMYCMKRSNC
jgi:hypothetical protein